MRIPSVSAALFLLATVAPSAAAVDVAVVAVDPPIHALGVAPNTAITIDFDKALAPAALPPATDDLYVFGLNSGVAVGTWTLENGATRARFVSERPFLAGEPVIVGVTNELAAADGTHMRQAGYVWRFRIAAAPAPMTFTAIDTMTSRTIPTQPSRLYGANCLDWNEDDYVDLATVNEDTSDIRMFLNKADATGLYHTFGSPTTSVGTTPSPNEAFDYDRDGHADLATSNADGDNLSILIGRGDGTFDPQVAYPMGDQPHGLAILDANGDGWWDVVVASTGTNELAMRMNLGDGTFGPVSFFEGGGSGEYGLTGADANGDGIFDILVGAQHTQQLIVHLGNGDGTFTELPAQTIGGGVWTLTAEDLDGDGDLDVSTANSFSSNASILLGDGTGAFSAPQTYGPAVFATATDHGDLDGDGDLDWIVSCFGGSQWRMYENDGSGTFALHQVFPAPSNPGCATLVDIDGDRDIDAVLLDETGDLVILMENGRLAQQTFCYGDGTGTACPCGNSGIPAHGCDHSQATGGGLLNAVGRASVSNDQLALAAGGLPATTIAFFFQGTATAQPGGFGVVAGDGLRCAGGTITRLGVRPATNGWILFGSGVPGDPSLSAIGSLPGAGGTRYYQAWYRNPAAFCTSDTFNMTNGVRVDWTP